MSMQNVFLPIFPKFGIRLLAKLLQSAEQAVTKPFGVPQDNPSKLPALD